MLTLRQSLDCHFIGKVYLTTIYKLGSKENNANAL